MLLLYQPDPPPDVVPTVRTLMKDVNKEKVTLVWRYVDPSAPPPPAEAAGKPVVASAYTIKAVTVGTDDLRKRSGTRSPLLLVIVPRFGFIKPGAQVECSQKL